MSISVWSLCNKLLRKSFCDFHGTKTLIHEIAHELMHRGQELFTLDRHTKEFEAEAVAYVVAMHFGLSELSCPNYLALWDADASKISARADRIRTISTQIINAVER
jgi:hypothetical protein